MSSFVQQVKFVEQKVLSLDAIRIDGETQSREGLDVDLYTRYAEKMEAGDNFPPLVVFFDGTDYWLADGFHRYHALRKIGRVSMATQIALGTVRDAILYSFGCNDNHGKRPTPGDVKHKVTRMLKDDEWRKWPDQKIADICECSRSYVQRLRAELFPEQKEEPKTYVHKTGAVTEMQPRKKEEEPSAPAKAEPPKPAEHEIKIEQLKEAIETLTKANDDLTDQLAAGSALDPDFVSKTIRDLREENQQLRIEVKSLTISRDQFQAENAQLIKQVSMLTKKLKKLEPVA